MTIRQVAEAADVSPALVMHHFKSKAGLRESVDRYVLKLLDGMLGEGTTGSGSLAEAVLAHLPPGSPVPVYLRRLLAGSDEAGGRLFRRLFALSRAQLDAMVEAGVAAPGEDPAVRAAFLMVNDLAVLLLRDRLTDVLGSDPLSVDGMTRWANEAMSIYGGGLQGPGPPARA